LPESRLAFRKQGQLAVIRFCAVVPGSQRTGNGASDTGSGDRALHCLGASLLDFGVEQLPGWGGNAGRAEGGQALTDERFECSVCVFFHTQTIYRLKAARLWG
jgi:hypothetical protein